MDQEEFTADKTGELVPIAHKAKDVAFAFVPSPLPPSGWTLAHEHYPLLIAARAALARLDGVGKHLPNPNIVLQPIQQREAKLSSQLEGTFTDPQKQALFQADPRYPISAGDPINAYREVFNYSSALRMRLDTPPAQQLPLSKRLIRDLHGVLMDGVRGYEQRPGQFRTIQNQIGHPARYVPPPPDRVEPLLDDFEKYLNKEDDDYDPLVRAFLAHYQFEAIHPFIDGNGRVGRLLLALTIAEWCKLSNQWLYMSAFFEKRKREYMDLMLRVSTHGSWDLWIRFCLEGVVSQAEDTERRCEKLLKLHREFSQRIKVLKGGSVRLSSIVDKLFDSPVVTVVGMARALDVTFPTARADLKKFEGLGILQPVPGLQQLTFYCQQIYNVTYDEIEA